MARNTPAKVLVIPTHRGSLPLWQGEILSKRVVRFSLGCTDAYMGAPSGALMRHLCNDRCGLRGAVCPQEWHENLRCSRRRIPEEEF